MSTQNQDQKHSIAGNSNQCEAKLESKNPLSRAFDIVAIAASAGGIEALSRIFSKLPPDFPVAIVVVQHIPAHRASLIPKILNRHTALVVKEAEEGEQLVPGTVYIAAPNFHLRVELDKTIGFSQSEKIHFLRPAAEILFSTVAQVYKERAIAVVLTGGNGDGAAGVKILNKAGSKIIAQDEATSAVFGMPAAAIETGCVDWILPLDRISTAIKNLVATGNIGESVYEQ
ncbi:MAG TPA: chemotaxis protein CheB [Kamptonema sp.]|nr:chemotaxis protein CheB [Kamptonema sp.]